MRPETIKNHIDKNIVSLLENMDYEEVCKYINDISTRFNSRISDVDVSNLTSIETYYHNYDNFVNLCEKYKYNIEQKNNNFYLILKNE